MHAALVAVHATAATASLVAAALLLLPRPLPLLLRAPVAILVAVTTALMAVSLGAAVAAGWDGRPAAGHVVFVALTVLALAAAVCATAAVPAARRRSRADLERLYSAGGFVLITQVTGFVAVAVLDVLPVWGVVVASVTTVLVARTVVGLLQTAASRELTPAR